MKRGGYVPKRVGPRQSVPPNRSARPVPLLNRPQSYNQSSYGINSRPSLLDLPSSRPNRGFNNSYDDYGSREDEFYDDQRPYYDDARNYNGNNCGNDMFTRRPLPTRSLLDDIPSATFDSYDDYRDQSPRGGRGLNSALPKFDDFRDYLPQRDRDQNTSLLSRDLYQTVNDILAPLIDQSRLSLAANNRSMRMIVPPERLGQNRSFRSNDYGGNTYRSGNDNFGDFKPKPLLSLRGGPPDLRGTNFKRPLLANESTRRIRSRRSGPRRNANAKSNMEKLRTTSVAANKSKKRRKRSKQLKDYKEQMLNKPWVNDQLKTEISMKFEKLEIAKKENKDESWKAYQEQKKICYDMNAALRLEYIGSHPDVDLTKFGKEIPVQKYTKKPDSEKEKEALVNVSNGDTKECSVTNDSGENPVEDKLADEKSVVEKMAVDEPNVEKTVEEKKVNETQESAVLVDVKQ